MVLKTSAINNHLLQLQPHHYSIEGFVDLYKKSVFYVDNRIDYLVDTLIDIKLEFLYLETVDFVNFGKTINKKFSLDQNDINENPDDIVHFLSETQSIILKSRIIFERIINFIYYFCYGKDIDNVNNKSKKGYFFKKLKTEEMKVFQFLENYEDLITTFDNLYRSPETHKRSTLRSYLFYEEKRKERIEILVNQVLSIYNSFYYYFWQAIFDIIQNGKLSKENEEIICQRGKSFKEYLDR